MVGTGHRVGSIFGVRMPKPWLLCALSMALLLWVEHRDEQPHNNTIEIDIEVAADNDRHDSQMITQDISDDDNDDANADEDDEDEDDDEDRNHGECHGVNNNQ